MEDAKIIDLYWARSQQAVAASEEKYGPYCHTIARRILDREEDAEECVNDTWLRAWNAMPPQRPGILSGGGGPTRAGGLPARPPQPRRKSGGR